MKTNQHISGEPLEVIIGIARERKPARNKRPEHFIKLMKTNMAIHGDVAPFGYDEQGLERRNPVIVALGDSVTAGFFEDTQTEEEMQENLKKLQEGRFSEINPCTVNRDLREVYVERFQKRLFDYYENTAVSIINAGVGGDHMIGMAARCGRDVIAHNPDLVLINGTLNWPEEKVPSTEYESYLRKVVREIKAHTDADIILITPNGFVSPDTAAYAPFEIRVNAIRKIAEEEDTCLADVYGIWKEYKEQGYAWKDLLTNGFIMNHPAAEAHEVFVIELMKLIEE